MKITDFVLASNGDSRSVAWAGFVLRVALGTMWISHALLKIMVFTLPGAAKFFDSVGLPAFQFVQDEADYETRTHHTNLDVFDRLQKADLMQAAVEGQGIALARSSLIGSDIANGVLVRLFDIEVPSPFHYYLVYPPRLADTPKLVQFRAWLREEIARDEAVPAAPAAPARIRRRHR